MSRVGLIVTPDFPPALGGIQLLMHRLAANMVDPRPVVVTFGGPGARELDAGESFEVRRVSWRDGRLHRLKVAGLNLAAAGEGRRLRPRVVISGHAVTAPGAVLAARRAGAPLIQYLHADEARHRPRLLRFGLDRADAVVAVSAHARDTAVAAGCDPAKVHVVHPGVDDPGEPGEAPAGPPTVVTVARLSDRYKGHDTMVGAMRLVREEHPDARWLVVGDGPLRPELEATVAREGLTDAVIFTGSVSDRERDRLLSGSHVFAMPSRMPDAGLGGEGFGIVYLEAAALGLPVVAGAVGGAVDAVVDGRTGLLVDPADPRAVAAALSSLLGDPERARALGAAGRERAKQLSWRRHAEAVERIASDLGPPPS